MRTTKFRIFGYPTSLALGRVACEPSFQGSVFLLAGSCPLGEVRWWWWWWKWKWKWWKCDDEMMI